MTIEEILARLAAGPVRIAAFVEGLSPEQLVTPPAPGQWSARDVLAHLRACGDMWGRYIYLILNEDHPTFKAVNPMTWIKQTDYFELEFQPSFQAYAAQRAGLLAVLKPLPPEAWERSATVTGAGKARERTLYTYGEWLATHERSHFRQLKRIAGAVRSAQPSTQRGDSK